MYKKFTFKNMNNNDLGYLVPIEGEMDIPFEIKRIYYIGAVPSDARRGFHAHKELQQVLICVHGSVKILLDDGKNKEVVILNNPAEGLYLKSGLWREMFDFSKGSVLLVVASAHYDEADYIRDYSAFLDWKREGTK